MAMPYRYMRRGFALAWLLVALVAAASLASVVAPARALPAKATPFAYHAPIVIEGDSDFTAANGVVSGRGTAKDPYVLDGWDINASTAIGIDIRNTTAYFVISNTYVHDGGSSFDGYRFLNVRNGLVESSTSMRNRIGVVVQKVDSFRLHALGIQGSVADGMDIRGAANLTVLENIFQDNLGGLRIEEVAGVNVEGNAMWYNKGHGLEIHSATDIRVAYNDFRSNGLSLMLNAMTRGDVSRNRVYQPWGPGMDLGALVDSVVANNVISTTGVGIDLTFADRVTFVGNNVSATSVGVRAYYSEDVTISWTNVSGASWGMQFDTSRSVAVSDSNLTTALHGILLADVVSATLTRNRFSGNGIVLQGSLREHFASHAIAADNLVDGRPVLYQRDCSGLALDGIVAGQVLLANCTGVRLTNLNLSDTDVGLLAAYVDGLEIESTSVLGVRADGIVLNAVANATLTSVRSGNSAGRALDATGLRNVTFQGFMADGNAEGVEISLSEDVAFLNSTILASGDGLRFQSGKRIRILDTVFLDDAFGVIYEGVEGGEIRGNAMRAPAGPIVGSGVFLASTSGVNVTANEIVDYFFGVFLESSVGIAVHHNRFLGNTNQASDPLGPENRWDDGYPSGGNFWSDYRGWDDCGGPSQDICPGSDGLGDVPYAIDADSVDRYPLVPVNPPNELPVAIMYFDPPMPVTGVPVTFHAEDSYDPEGWPLRYDWDFGDGTSANDAGATVTHTYDTVGTRVVALTVTDPRGGTAYLMLTVQVFAPPVVSFTVTPSRPVVGDTVRFDASASYDEDGTIARYDWNFGDGSSAEGVVLTHVYTAPGTYAVTLVATDDTGLRSSESLTVYVDPKPPEPVSLTEYSHPAGFRLPVPEGPGWVLKVDQVVGNETIELVIDGPTYGAVRTNILVDTDLDPTVRETDSYLLGLVNATVQELRDRTGFAVEITEGPSLRTLSGHAAVTFKLQWGTTSLNQKIAIVVSDAHDRYWFLVLTTDAFAYQVMDEAFERMLAGFEITLPTPIAAAFSSPWFLLGVLAAVVAGILVPILIVLRRRRMGVREAALEAPQTMRSCPSCGTPAGPQDNVCGQCGLALPKPPP